MLLMTDEAVSGRNDINVEIPKAGGEFVAAGRSVLAVSDLHETLVKPFPAKDPSLQSCNWLADSGVLLDSRTLIALSRR